MNERLSNIHERHHPEALVGDEIHRVDSRNIATRGMTILIIAFFWVGQFGANTLFSQLSSSGATVASLQSRALTSVVGAMISLACIGLQDTRRNSAFRVRAYWAIGCTILSAAMLAAANRMIFELIAGITATSSYWISVPVDMIPRLWVFGGLYAVSLAISYSAAIRAREQEIVALRALAQDAQLRALRNQLNPHFLFNVLNSIAALIGEGRAKEAEKTTEDLADFFRVTLALDPQKSIAVEDEVSLQQTYLDIQRVRFPSRLNVAIDIADNVRQARVPNLILQPLVENSIKFAVARSTVPVTIRIEARAEEEWLRISVSDDGGNAEKGGRPKGNRMGLANVAERLSVCYGGLAQFAFGERDGGFFNDIRIPRLAR